MTNREIWAKIHNITMAEVAVCMSNARFWQIAGAGKGPPPKTVSVPNGTFWGCTEYVQNCHLQRWSADLG